MTTLDMITTEADLAAALLSGGDIVCDPTTTITLTGPAMVGLPTRLLGGSFAVPSGPGFVIGASHVELAGLQIVGTFDGTYDNNQKLIYALGVKGAPLADIDVHDCHLADYQGHGIWLEWVVDSRVHDCAVRHGAYSGIMIISGNGVSVADNIVSDFPIVAPNTDSYGIALTDLTNVAADASQRCVVANNRVSFVDWEGIDTHGGVNLAVTGNVLVGCRVGVALVTGNPGRISVPTGCTVSGNVIDSTGVRTSAQAAVRLVGYSGHPATATITGNHVTGYTAGSAVAFDLDFYDRFNSHVGANNRPLADWDDVSLASGFTPSVNFPPQYRVDGGLLRFRGAFIPPAGGLAAHPIVGTVPNAAGWPSARTFYAATKGAAASAGVAVLSVDTAGLLRCDYSNTSDQDAYWLTGICPAN